MMKTSASILICLSSLLPGLSVASASADLDGAVLYKMKVCDSCHGEDGTHPVTPEYPVIAGQPVPYLLRQMKDIRDGRRTNGLSETMRAAVGAVTDEEFRAIAEWLASRW